jgi:hypothetical protein
VIVRPFLISLLWMAAPLPAGAEAVKAVPGHAFMRGMALGEHSDLREPELTAKLNELRWLGVGHVSVVVSWSTPNIYSTSIEPTPGCTPRDASLERLLTRARALGFKVMLFPILDVRNRKGQEWRGALRPPSWDAWWKAYTRFLLHYARVAARTGTEIFSVGSELITTEGMRPRWKELIARVRPIFRGQLLYSANWDHYTPVTFWDQVDLIGLTGYYKLAEAPGASEAEMLASWRVVRRRLQAWSRKMKRPIIFTEVGYPSLAGGAVSPWDYTQATAVSLDEQLRAYRAFVRAWKGASELAGVFFWDWYGAGGKNDRRYTPRGKPAEQVIRSWYLGMER